jgi:hypothetical protein
MTEHVATSAKELEHMIGNPTELALALLQSDDTHRYFMTHTLPVFTFTLALQ